MKRGKRRNNKKIIRDEEMEEGIKKRMRKENVKVRMRQEVGEEEKEEER